MAASSTLAVVFDFDDTLAPDSTSKLLRSRGIDDQHFWTVRAKKLVEAGYDPALAFLKLVLDETGPKGKLCGLTNPELRKFGATIDADFFAGLPGLFDDLKHIVTNDFRNIEIEFYIVSGGLQELLEGSSIVQKYFRAVYGCQLAGDTDGGALKYVKRCVTFTEKTRYLFEIHKGLDPADTHRNPVLVNRPMAQSQRRVPFRNMVYVGDGLTDVPCFSLLRSNKGLPFGVFDPKKTTSAKQALQQFLKPERGISVHSPRYGPQDDLGSLLRAAISNRCSQILLERELAESVD